MSGNFILSLDMELMWGVRDRRSVAQYGDAVLGVRKALPLVLDIFRSHSIHATWAVVGLLYARNRSEMLEYCPTLKPQYVNSKLNPYAQLLTEVGQDETDDPWHFGASLIKRISEVEGQEIGTHTFSHYYCLERGQTLDAFAADLRAATKIAAAAGHTPKSIVFPRNQMTHEHVDIAAALGIQTFRGNPNGFAYQAHSSRQNTLLVRGFRFADAVVPVGGRLDYEFPSMTRGSVNVPASRFLRPWSRRGFAYSRMHIARVCCEMECAARDGLCYHLWWHPHNMGRNAQENLQNLNSIINCYVRLRDEYGMKSSNMLDISSNLLSDESKNLGAYQ